MMEHLHILHLEDDPQDAELVQAALDAEGFGCNVRVVATREDFLAALEEYRFDLILADFALPGFDGMSALGIVRKEYPTLPFIFVSGRLGEEAAIESLRNGATDYVLKNRLSRLVPAVKRALIEAEERAELKRAEEALRESEMSRIALEVELRYAAEIQAKLLPRNYPEIPGFEVAACCLPARHVGGDFFDWQEVCPGVWSFTLGDVMGKGMAAAMLMATVRAALRSVAHNRPQEGVHLADQAIRPDLENSESFVTLFHGQLYAAARRLTFVDCGHGYAFVLRADGEAESLSPRGLPLGAPGSEAYQEGVTDLEEGDTLVLYSDGVIDARPELSLDNQALARHLQGAAGAREMVERLISLSGAEGTLPDDLTVLVVHCTG
ncbi:MAG: SpoIIE family protein phosphatase [Desulfuromonadales bacterium]|jgi:sigma-B regulation protein RsbU (phosphoserine phosphatase)